MIDKEGFAKITDFGLSKENIIDNSAHSFCGTPEYLAPEIITKQGHGKPVDWWSLGALVFEMLTGQTPFYSRDRERLFNNILESDVVYPPHLTPEAVDLLQQLFQKDPNDRLGSAHNGADEIKSHVWFRNINWSALYRKNVTPPFIPRISGPLDLHNFDEVWYISGLY